MQENKSYFHHPPLLLSRAPHRCSLVTVFVFIMRKVLAVLTFAVVPTGQTCLVTLTIFLETAAFLAVTPLHVLLVLDLHAERVRVPVHQGHDRSVPLLGKGLQVVTSNTVAAITGEVQSEAVAIQFQTFRFPAIALHPLTRRSALSPTSRLGRFSPPALLLFL